MSYLMSNYWFQCFDVKLTSYFMSNCWCQFDVNFWSKSFPRSMFWCWIDVIFDIIFFMLNWRHICCQTVDVNLTSIFGQKSFPRSMFWCEIDVIFDVKLFMSMSWCLIDVIFDVKLLMSMFWCKITSYSTSNQWRQWFGLILKSKWRQIDIKLMTDKIVWRQHGIPGLAMVVATIDKEYTDTSLILVFCPA